MLFTESIYFLIIFTLPAALHVLYHSYIRLSPRVQNDKSIELAECLAFSITVFVICSWFYGNQMQQFAEYLLLSNKEKTSYLLTHPGFEYLKFVIGYTWLTLGVSILTLCSWYLILIKVFKYIVNLVNKVLKRPIELKNPEIWRAIFESKEYIDVYKSCLVIEKGGAVITAGLLMANQPPHIETKELLLYHTEQVQDVLRDDREKTPDDKILYPAKYEYYDITSDLLIKFYDVDKLYSFWYGEEKAKSLLTT